MGSPEMQRRGAVGGIAAVVLLVVGHFVYGAPPKFAASEETVAAFYHDHHRTVLIGMILTGLAIPLYVWFVAHLALAVGGPLGASVALGGILVAAAAAVGDTLTITVDHGAKTAGDPGAMRLLYQASTIAYGRLFWAAIAVAIPLALAAAAGRLRPWLTPVMYVQSVLMLLGGLSLKSSGFFSPTGGMALVAFIAYFAGTLAIAVALFLSSPRTAAA